MNIEPLKPHLPDKVYAELQQYSVLNPLRVAHLLAQCDHESGGFRFVEENLNYSAEMLLKAYHKYFDVQRAVEYEHNPEKIGNRIYANKFGNGAEMSGDGFRYRGRGYIQLTYHDNYKALSEFVGVNCVSMPYLVAEKYPLTAAIFIFDAKKVWQDCIGDTRADVVNVTRRINGGLIGLDNRVQLFQKYWELLRGSRK